MAESAEAPIEGLQPGQGGDAPRRPWRAYFEADLGFRNHWYPAFFSRQLADGECRGQVMLGERILFKRIDGRVYAIEDRCLHRGVPLSVRPECYTKNTISCWYHGFTFDVQNLMNRHYEEWGGRRTFLAEEAFFPSPERLYVGGVSITVRQ